MSIPFSWKGRLRVPIAEEVRKEKIINNILGALQKEKAHDINRKNDENIHFKLGFLKRSNGLIHISSGEINISVTNRDVILAYNFRFFRLLLVTIVLITFIGLKFPNGYGLVGIALVIALVYGFNVAYSLFYFRRLLRQVIESTVNNPGR